MRLIAVEALSIRREATDLRTRLSSKFAVLSAQAAAANVPFAARLLRRDGLNVRGAGLALLLMSDICAAHGGSLAVSSSLAMADHGTTVRLAFPQ